MHNFKKIALASLLSGFAAFAQAETVNFEDVTRFSTGNFTSGSFSFFMSGTASVIYNAQYCGPSCPVNGSNIALMPYGNLSNQLGYLRMSKADGSTFSLNSFDGAASFNFNESGTKHYIPLQIDAVGITANGAQVTQSFAIDRDTPSGPLAFTNFTFNSAFSNLSSVTFSASGSSHPFYNGLAIDNINTAAAVPEAETYAMMLAGLAALGLFSKRKKSA
ncbi:PEP-CTERM sorting domain-containing protein [Massilia sp. W12]|uniref:PEP-CTERM sorting domain-containing protein n=1 Tax=Massilia sp. W12 TaxID=3126507 RepID=UPI0030CD32C5